MYFLFHNSMDSRSSLRNEYISGQSTIRLRCTSTNIYWRFSDLILYFDRNFAILMPDFTDLPLEIVPLVVRHLLRPQHLAWVCLVSKSFHAYSAPLLYERVSIFAWYKEAKIKASQLDSDSRDALTCHTQAAKLFYTLSSSPHLARYVRIMGTVNHECSWSKLFLVNRSIEIRDFPKAISRENHLQLTVTCVQAIRNCVNLHACTWTRDGSLRDDVLEELSRCPRLEVLEINGHDNHNYEPTILTNFKKLSKITVIMPSNKVIQTLSICFRENFKTLCSVSITCKVWVFCRLNICSLSNLCF